MLKHDGFNKAEAAKSRFSDERGAPGGGERNGWPVSPGQVLQFPPERRRHSHDYLLRTSLLHRITSRTIRRFPRSGHAKAKLGNAPGAVNQLRSFQIELRFHSRLQGHAARVGGRSLTQRALVRGWRPGALQSWAAASCIPPPFRHTARLGCRLFILTTPKSSQAARLTTGRPFYARRSTDHTRRKSIAATIRRAMVSVVLTVNAFSARDGATVVATRAPVPRPRQCSKRLLTLTSRSTSMHRVAR